MQTTLTEKYDMYFSAVTFMNLEIAINEIL